MIYIACHMFCDIDITPVIATENTINALDTNNKPVTLYECYTEYNDKVLLENVTPGKKYTVMIDTFGTFERDDDLIIKMF